MFNCLKDEGGAESGRIEAGEGASYALVVSNPCVGASSAGMSENRKPRITLPRPLLHAMAAMMAGLLLLFVCCGWWLPWLQR